MNSLFALGEKLASAPPTIEHYLKVLQLLEVPFQDIEKYSLWLDNSYSRNLIKKTQHFELLLICWKKEGVSPIHNHQSQNCWMYILEGAATETHFCRLSLEKQILKETSTTHLKQGDHSFIRKGTDEWHRIKSKEHSISLNLYAKPIESCKTFCEQTRTITEQKLFYSSLEGKACP